MDWTQVLTIVGSNLALVLIMFGTSMGFYIHLDRKIDSNREEASKFLKAIHDEMKEFHGRLEKQEAEFRGIMAKQDAEFKAHMMYHHDKRLE